MPICALYLVVCSLKRDCGNTDGGNLGLKDYDRYALQALE